MNEPITTTAYRGEHGRRENGLLQTRSHGYTFVKEFEIAQTYATSPNDHSESAQDPRIVEAELTITKPLFNTPDDPFAELSEVAQKLGRDLATRMAIKHASHVENTGNWYEHFAQTFSGVEELLETQPAALDRLYLVAWCLLDDPEFVAAARQAGYDGAIHCGTGESACEVEYRVFDAEQVRVRRVIEVATHAQRDTLSAAA